MLTHLTLSLDVWYANLSVSWKYRKIKNQDVFHTLYFDIMTSIRSPTCMILHYQVGCCGGYSYRDYLEINLPIPDSCRNMVKLGMRFFKSKWSESASIGLPQICLYKFPFDFSMMHIREKLNTKIAIGYSDRICLARHWSLP